MNQELDRLIIEPYMNIYTVAKEKELFENEQALQSAVASMYIRYNQLADKNPNFNSLIKQLTEESRTRTSKAEVKPLNDAILSIFSPLAEEYEKAGLYIKNKVQEGPIYDFFAFYDGLIDYMHRNGLTFRFVAQIKPYKEE